MGNPFIGRKKELRSLEQYFTTSRAKLIVLHGRRRIGKSRLIDEFARGKNYLNFTGLAPHPKMTAQMQRDEFARKLAINLDLPGLAATDWADLFSLLAKQCNNEPTVILLDEISWMAHRDPTFLSKLRNAWDREFKLHDKLVLVLCGSISPWIETNILSSTGFVGRVDRVMKLEEFTIKECNQFWQGNENISSFEKFKILSVTGGIPLYLESIQVNLSAEENIRQLCFISGGLLVREFENIFTDLFSTRAQTYSAIVNLLADGAKEPSQIGKRLSTNLSGWLSSYLKDLLVAGFIQRDYTWIVKNGRESKLSQYRLSDNYLRFYLKYIQENLQKIQRNDFLERSLSTLPGWNSLLGFQFENLVLNNRKSVRKLIDISDDELVLDNPYYQRATQRQKGCQIDYLIQTRFNNLYVCEIKFSSDPIQANVIEAVEEKIRRLTKPKNFSCRPILIHVNGVSDAVTDSNYFAKIISFEELLV